MLLTNKTIIAEWTTLEEELIIRLDWSQSWVGFLSKSDFLECFVYLAFETRTKKQTAPVLECTMIEVIM
jgi:hypothetical protein